MATDYGVGAVVIGRKEGVRLETCLRSLIGGTPHLVYVDSGSSDGSVELARRLGAGAAMMRASPFSFEYKQDYIGCAVHWGASLDQPLVWNLRR